MGLVRLTSCYNVHNYDKETGHSSVLIKCHGDQIHICAITDVKIYIKIGFGIRLFYVLA